MTVEIQMVVFMRQKRLLNGCPNKHSIKKKTNLQVTTIRRYFRENCLVQYICNNTLLMFKIE